jgi:hypothetical protein
MHKRFWVNLGQGIRKLDKIHETEIHESKVHEQSPSFLFRSDDFPSLENGLRVQSKQRKYGPPFDSVNWNFKYTVKRKDFPFEVVANDWVKLKSVPIQLNWLCYQHLDDGELTEGKIEYPKAFHHGYFRDSRWFRAPPKVRIVPGILGPHPSARTSGIYPVGGDREVKGDSESEHRKSDKDTPNRFGWGFGLHSTSSHALDRSDRETFSSLPPLNPITPRNL